MRAINLQFRVGTNVRRRVKNDGAVCWAIPSRIAPCVVGFFKRAGLLDTHQGFPYDHLSLVTGSFGSLKRARMSMVDGFPYKEEVGGSSPSAPTSWSRG